MARAAPRQDSCAFIPARAKGFPPARHETKVRAHLKIFLPAGLSPHQFRGRRPTGNMTRCRPCRFFREGIFMRYLHTMVRVGDLEAALDFYCAKLGLMEVRRQENEKGRFTLVFLAAPEDARRVDGEKTSAMSPMVELTYNWDETDYVGGRNFGHLAYAVEDIYALCEKLMQAGVTINRPPRDGHMAFIRSPDGISIELLQQGEALAPQEPWASMPNTGSW
jgi:lactoylglutathione lyase